MSECNICLEPLHNNNHKIRILQNCNCIYNVHDTCIKEWFKKKKECIICHTQIQLINNYSHIPFANTPDNSIQQINMPPRMSAFKRLFSCCF